jgi:hypothetical protein
MPFRRPLSPRLSFLSRRPALPLGLGLLTAVVLPACSSGDSDDGAGDCAALLPGDLVITEIMANPAGTDDGKEWVELYNASAAPISLGGVELRLSKPDGSDEDAFAFEAGAQLPPGEYLVVGLVAAEFAPSYVDLPIGNALGALNNTGARFALGCAATVIDEVVYADPADGASRGFDGALSPDAVANDDLAQWCDATSEFEMDGLGTPGARNDACGGGGGGTTCDAGGTPRDIVTPVIGDLVINEFHANPEGTDGTQEWIELYVAADVDLNGLEIGLGDAVATTLAAPECLSVTAGTYLVLAQSDDSAVNGGLPQVDALFDGTLRNTDGRIFVGRGGALLDEVSYADSTSGRTTQLDPAAQDVVSNDDPASFCAAAETLVYGLGGAGTPGAANPSCGGGMPTGMCDDNGTLRDPVAAQPGDLVITEIMANSTAAETDKEWFEVLVRADVDLNGLGIGSLLGDPDSVITSPACERVTAGTYLVFAVNGDTALNGGLPQVDYVVPLALSNSGDTIVLEQAGALLDQVTYTATFADGQAQSLDPTRLTVADNDVEANFCAATLPYGDGDNFGTPGAVNPACDGGGGGDDECDDNGTMRPIRAPLPGDLLINEIMANPSAPEADKEWFEVYVVNATDLNGLGIVGAGSGMTTLSDPTCLEATAGEYLLFAVNGDAAANGGVSPDFVYAGGLTNTGDTLTLDVAGTAIDSFTYGATTDTRSVQLDRQFEGMDAASDDPANWCDASSSFGTAGDFGTPRGQNDACMGMPMGDQCNDGGTLRALDPVAPGDLLITEFYPDPLGGGTNGEWFEVYMVNDADLNGLVVRDATGADTPLTSADCITATAGSYLVFGRSMDMASNGGLPQVDFVMGRGLNNANEVLTLEREMTVLDTVTFAVTATQGVSVSLSSAILDPAMNDYDAATWCAPQMASTFGTGGRGTPGAMNDSTCP